MEDENLRLAEDIDISEDENIYYVAITRGKQKIMID
jgi:ATP-dependent exoDNAse (exonuclease V) beta subunit